MDSLPDLPYGQKEGVAPVLADPLKITLSGSVYTQHVSHRMDTQSMPEQPENGT